MSEQSGGKLTNPNGGNTNSNSQKKKRNNFNNAQRERAPRYTPFQGKTEPLKGHVFDVGPKSRDQFSRTTKEIGEYISRAYKNGGEFLNALNPDDLGFTDITLPANPQATASPSEVKIWEIEYKEARDRQRNREEISKQVFAVILGQCSEGVRDRITAHHTFETVQAQCNVISLLELI